MLNVTADTVTIVPVIPLDEEGRALEPSTTSVPISFNILPEQQVNGPVDWSVTVARLALIYGGPA